MQNKKGFTLVELVITIIIVGILTLVAVPIFRSYTRKSMATEGKALLGVIQQTERAYYAEHGMYLDIEETSYNELLDIDARSNKYFTTFTITTSGEAGTDAAFTAITTGNDISTGMSLTIIGRPRGAITFDESGIN